MLENRKTVDLRPFGEILAKENNFVRIPRKPFLNFSQFEDKLEVFTFSKKKIEEWNYKKEIEKIFRDKCNATQTKSIKSSLNDIKEDILQILKDSFEFNDEYSPHEVSLSLVKGVPCTKLHADFLPLRLICTYLGPGTIFLPKESTRYPCLNEGRPNKRVIIKGKPQLQAEPFEILILKGRKFNKGELRPCAHRSPEVEGEQQRLVLKVDFK